MTETVPEFSGCPWPYDSACMTDTWEALDADVQERSVALASATLQRLTGNRVGNCPVTVRPCAPRCGTGLAYSWINPTINGYGNWVNGCGHLACQCQVACEVILPAPVGRVDEVKVDGVVVPSTDYRLDGNRLVYTGTGDCKWHVEQDLTKPDTEPGTFSVTYLNHYPVDSLGAYAVGILAMEYAKACTGNKCRLPTGVTSIVRQGVTMEIASGAFPEGLTGIREVDAFIALWNPNGLQRQTKVWSPGVHSPRVQGA